MIWDEDESNEKEEQKQTNNPFAASKGKYAYDDSESSEEEKRVLKTPKEKLLALIKENYLKIKENKEARNYTIILKSYSDVIKNVDKIKKEFGTSDKVPETFLRMLYLVEESLNLSKEDKAKLSQKDNTAFNSLKKDTKLMKPFEEAVKTYRETKPSEEDLLEEEEKELSDMSVDKSLSDMSSMDYKDDNQDPAVRRLKWVKKPKEEEKTGDKDKEKDKDKEPTKTKDKKKKAPVEKVEEKEVEHKQAVTEIDIEKECNEISNQRGHLQRPVEVVSRLDFLLSLTDNLNLKIKLLNLYILICFDTSSGQYSALSLEMWTKIHDSILTLIDYYQALKSASAEADQIQAITAILSTSLTSILEKLELELYKSLQFTDQNSSEYFARIKDELKFLLLCSKIEAFYADLKDGVAISKIYLLILLHIYYKNEESIKKMTERFSLTTNRDELLIKSCESPENFISQLCNSIYTFCDEKSKIKAMLCHVYFLCVHDRYTTARTLIRRSHIYEVVQILKDDGLKVLYNRTMAKLGLASFRSGNFADSLHYLHPICQMGTSKVKDYLSQSYNKENEKSIFFDKEDKKRVIPYVMAINIEEVECTYYLSSMLIDLPNILLTKLGRRHAPFNPVFKKMLENYEKQVFNGPPETIKELILCAASHMTKGDWKKCVEMVNTLKMYNYHKTKENIKKNLTSAIKKTCLRCYLIFYAGEFSSLSLDVLTRKFALEEELVRNSVNSMILDGELEAKWSGRILCIQEGANNFKLISQLESNLRVITNQNLDLLEVVSLKTVK